MSSEQSYFANNWENAQQSDNVEFVYEDRPPCLSRQRGKDDVSIQDDPVIHQNGWTAPQRVWEGLRAKEELEQTIMNQQYATAQQTMSTHFAIYQEEMRQRRLRFINKVGPQITLEQGYHVPFWQWWGEYLSRGY